MHCFNCLDSPIQENSIVDAYSYHTGKNYYTMTSRSRTLEQDKIHHFKLILLGQYRLQFIGVFPFNMATILQENLMWANRVYCCNLSGESSQANSSLLLEVCDCTKMCVCCCFYTGNSPLKLFQEHVTGET